MKRYRALVEGRVQGVGFRWYAGDLARKAGLSGFVQNLPDGRVEIVAEGETEVWTKFLEAVRSGYLGANIKEIKVTEETFLGDLEGFTIRFGYLAK
ncbi:MAG: acylphosphatase [Candidatus Omnitrophica bacterium]|nr:acylphosphatase [Candidatus Omnitrophota bacterium]